MDAAKARTQAAYNLAAEHFDAAPLAFWERAGRRTVELAQLSPGNRVLDVCCGSGGSAIPAALAVGRFGTVLGVDLADSLLDLARAKAAALSLENIQFRCADIETLKFPERSCDAVLCQFGIFFLPDMEAALARLWSFLTPGGVLAVTTWGPRKLEPAMATFRDLVRELRPDLYQPSRASDRISTPAQLKELFVAGGAPEPEVTAEKTKQALGRPEDFWTTLLGSGTRGTIEAMGPEVAATVRQKMMDLVAAEGFRGVETDVLYAVARRPA